MNRRRFLSYGLLTPVLGPAILAGGRSLFGAEGSDHKLALLFTGPISNETAMQEDQFAMYRTLLRRGFTPEQILCVSEPASRITLLGLLRDAAQRVRSWSDGQVFVHYSGSGCYLDSTPGDPRPAMELSDEKVRWDELFAALQLPAQVRLTILPDCCLNNLLLGRVPAQATALVMATKPGQELTCTASNHVFPINGVKVARGVISYYATRALETATTAMDWLQKTQELCNADVAAGILPAHKRLTFRLAGSANQTLPGVIVKA